MSKADGMMYAPKGKPNPVCKKGEFRFAAVALNHGHIYGMTNGLLESGGELVWVYDPDPAKVEAFQEAYPEVRVASSEEQVLEDESLNLVAGAAVTSERCALGLRVMDHGKHYLSDKASFTTFEQLEQARAKVAETGLIWAVCYSERVHNESAVFAGQLIKDGAIGRVLQVINIAPHRLNAPSRPEWFFIREKYGGVLCDIGSHQIEQFLYYADVEEAEITYSRVANYNHPQYPELEDFGEALLTGSNGATMYFRVDWFTPDGLGVWGDGRTFILGTEGSIELRKYIDVARSEEGDHIYLIDNEKTQHLPVSGKVGFPYFGHLILDCLNGTETAMPQKHTFLAAQLSLEAQAKALRIV